MNTRFAAALFVLLATSALAAQQPAREEVPKITVNGESLVLAKPDKIVINFGIETRDKDLVQAKQRNAAIWKKAAAALKESGVPGKDVQTDYLSIEPRYRNYDFSSWSGWGYGRSSGGMSQNVVQDTRGSGGEDPQSMALGKISIRAAVSVVFELKEKGPAAGKL